METLIKILELSAKRNGGNKIMTIGHFLNIVKLAKKIEERQKEKAFKEADELYDEFVRDCLTD